MKKVMNGRSGSYLVEASLTLPVFILSICALAMIVNLIAVCETLGFIMSREIKENLFFNTGIFNYVSLCRTIENGTVEEHPTAGSIQVNRVRCRVRSGTMTDLITVTAKAEFHVLLPLGIGGGSGFEQKLMARLFTGTRQDGEPLNPAAFTEGGTAVPVLVYPKYGERFHGETCAIVQQQMDHGNSGWKMDREEAVIRSYTPCEICGGGRL